MSRNCVFCQIVRHEQPAYRLFEDDLVVAFLDIGPINPGHTLIVPREHHTSVTTVPEAVLGRMMQVAGKLGQALLRATEADGFNLWLANGQVAGQVVMHAHLHVIPRWAADGFAWGWRAGDCPTAEEAGELVERIRARLGAVDNGE